LVISGHVDAALSGPVQVMHTDRTAVVLDMITEAWVEDLFNEATVVKTADTMVDVPYIREYYS